jgi:glutamyl-Q tRNA(Asp) synthetase
MPPVFRFAPSPNGYLHLGHACSALLNFDSARRFGGRLLLRIEDIDGARCKPEFEAAIYDDLAWLGIAWEEPVRRQSRHLADYRDAIDKLSALGLIYPSFESRAEIAKWVAQRGAKAGWPCDPDGAPLYPGSAKRMPLEERMRLLDSGAPYALRLDMAAASALSGDLTWTEHGEGPAGETGVVAARPQAWGDVILARKETPTSYHLSVVLDDALQGVTECVARTCSGPPASIGCCSTCSVCRSRPTGTTAWCSTVPGKSSRSRPKPPPCANFVPGVQRPRMSGVWSVSASCPRFSLAISSPKRRPA